MSEHSFISESLNSILGEFSQTALFGVVESQRRTFDYSCILMRDLSRPLISQVLWSHSEGIDKDIRTLLHEMDATIKIYVVKDQTRTRARLEEIIRSYKNNTATSQLLTGLRMVFVPADFDADKERDQRWLYNYLQKRISKDILFAIVFGQITSGDLISFASHSGPFGLKYLILDEVNLNALRHMPTFKERIGYKTTGPIREALTMLSALGLVKTIPKSNMAFSTVKGRLLIDLTRRLLFEAKTRPVWSKELVLVFQCLGITMPPLSQLPAIGERAPFNPVVDFLHHAYACQSYFGRDLLGPIDPTSPVFYSDYSIPDDPEYSNKLTGISNSFFTEPESLLFF